MILSRLKLDLRSSAVARDLLDCQQMHRTILSAFPQASGAARREFGVLFRVELACGGDVVVLIQSRLVPDFAQLPEGYVLRAPESKEISAVYASLEAGMQLRFRLRANPTRKIETRSTAPGVRRNGRRVELHSDAERLRWLDRKAASAGFAVLSARCCAGGAGCGGAAAGRLRGVRMSAQGERGVVTFGSVLFEGALEILDLPAFRAAIETGIGGAKAYGFGLLSLASPRADCWLESAQLRGGPDW
jgi:CRISPR system Cascade subunit CasE